MEDRVPTYAGRVKLTPVAGSTDLFDMQMADQPSVSGTPLCKATLLTDETAAAISAGFDTTPNTPNEALALLAGGAKIEIQSYVGTGTFGSSHPNTLAFQHEPKLVFIIEGNFIGGDGAAILNWAQMGASGSFVRTAEPASWHSDVYTLTNSRKTLTWYADFPSDTEYAGQAIGMQMNISGTTYTAISFY